MKFKLNRSGRVHEKIRKSPGRRLIYFAAQSNLIKHAVYFYFDKKQPLSRNQAK